MSKNFLSTENFKKIFSELALIFSVLWFVVFLITGFILTGGNISLAGGGSLLFALIPSAIFSATLIYLRKLKSKFYFAAAMTFWASLALCILGMIYVIQQGGHWPYGLALVYVVIGAVSIIQLLVFLYLTSKNK